MTYLDLIMVDMADLAYRGVLGDWAGHGVGQNGIMYYHPVLESQDPLSPRVGVQLSTYAFVDKPPPGSTVRLNYSVFAVALPGGAGELRRLASGTAPVKVTGNHLVDAGRVCAMTEGLIQIGERALVEAYLRQIARLPGALGELAHADKYGPPGSKDWRTLATDDAVEQAFPANPTADELLDLHQLAKDRMSNKLANLVKFRSRSLAVEAVHKLLH